jgi:hypothetical protein
MVRKNHSKVLSTKFIRYESISSESRCSRYGTFQEIAFVFLSCGHKRPLSSVKINNDGYCLCHSCKHGHDFNPE